MPRAPRRPCTTPRCRELVEGGGPCPECKGERRAASDRARGSSSDRGYDAAWQRTRAAYLDAHPWCECVECAALPLGLRPLAVDVHHLDGEGPRGPRGHDWSNLQAMTHGHHARETARAQPGGWNRR